MTQEFMQDAIVEDLEQLFKNYRLNNSMGVERKIRVFPQDLPIREGEDEAPNPEDLPEPYVLVRLSSGEVPEQDARQKVDVILVICVYDPDPNRQGYRDALHIINTILHHYGADGLVGKRYTVQHPIKWAMQEEDNHPFYLGAMALTFEAPGIFKEVPET